MKNFRLRILAACVAALPVAAIADVNFYAGFGAGGMRLEEDLNVSVLVHDQATGGVPITYSFPENGEPFGFEGTDLGVHLFAGVRFLTYFGIEAGYVDFGEPEDSLDFTIPFGPVGCNPAQSFSCSRPETSRSVTYKDKIDGWELFALGAFPLTENLEIFGKIGLIDWDSEFTSSNAAQILQPQLPFIEEVTLTPSTTVNTDGTDLAGGVGINYKMTEHTSLRFDGTWYDIEDIDMLWLISANFIYGF